MFRIDGPGATPDNKFSEGDPANGTRATVVTDEWLNAVQEEVAGAIENEGEVLDKQNSGQLKKGIAARVIRLSDMTNFQNLVAARRVEGYIFRTVAYRPGWAALASSPRGGGDFVYIASRSKDDHTGGTVISPTCTWDGTQSDLPNFLNRTNETDPGGTGVFVLISDHSVYSFGAVGSGLEIDTTAVHAYRDALPGEELEFPEGTYRGNFVFDNNARVKGHGENATKFVADTTVSPILVLSDAVAIEQYYLSASGFRIDGEGSAAVGLRIGSPDQTAQVSYGRYKNIEVTSCTNNIELNRVIGVGMEDVYSVSASSAGLIIPINDVVTVASFVNCRFRQCKTNLDLKGGALFNFRTCVVESSHDLGLWFSKQSSSGARQSVFDTCWFENNAHTPSTSISGGMYLDVESILASAESPSYLKFKSCVFSTAGDKPDVTLNRGYNIEFDMCSFKSLDSTNLVANTASGHAFARLKNCGTIDSAPSPTLYANFPERVLSGNKYLGFTYEYEYQGQIYKNFTGKIDRVSSTVSSHSVLGVVVMPIDTSAGDVELTSLADGYDGQEIAIIKPSGANAIILSHNSAGSQPIFTPDGLDRSLTGRQGARIVCEKGVWYLAGV